VGSGERGLLAERGRGPERNQNAGYLVADRADVADVAERSSRLQSDARSGHRREGDADRIRNIHRRRVDGQVGTTSTEPQGIAPTRMLCSSVPSRGRQSVFPEQADI